MESYVVLAIVSNSSNLTSERPPRQTKKIQINLNTCITFHQSEAELRSSGTKVVLIPFAL